MSQLRSAFVSNAPVDNELCDPYIKALQARGVGIWHDRSVVDDPSLSKETLEQLESHRALIVMMTPEVLDALRVAAVTIRYLNLLTADVSRILLPVVIKTCEVPQFLSGFRRIDAVGLPLDATGDAIVSALASPTSLSGKAAIASLFDRHANGFQQRH